MLTFPLLSTGAVAQYPLPLSYTSPVEIIRFIDGTDQRFLSRAKSLRTWQVKLSFVNEDEISQLETFFETLGGQYSLFAFPDPYSGQLVPNCVMGETALVTDYLATDLSSSTFWVVETNG
jgi:phage-related protein